MCYEMIEYNGLKFNVINVSISFNGKEIEFIKNEFKILFCFMKNKGCIVSREDLMDYLWNFDFYIDDNILLVNVIRFRKKL